LPPAISDVATSAIGSPNPAPIATGSALTLDERQPVRRSTAPSARVAGAKIQSSRRSAAHVKSAH